MTIREIKKQPRNTQVLEMLEALTNTVKDNEDTTNMMVLVKIDGRYMRYSSDLDDTMEMVAQLELAKFDVLRRMSE